ncbi:hypothetical protein [Deinococcus saxicola]|uniref:hypothetical protein n=1 Tax=Deinococcus saxicola TaxID=249406 RepID=UPI0039F11C46
MTPLRSLSTRRGDLAFPAFLPVTTFGEKYPLDDLLRPYLPRLASAVMVSAYFLRDVTEGPDLGVPLFVDSGGFASIFTGARVRRTRDGLGTITYGDRTITPADVLALQEGVADVGFTLDLLIVPKRWYKPRTLVRAFVRRGLKRRLVEFSSAR